MRMNLANNAGSKLAKGITAADTTIGVVSVETFPEAPFFVTLAQREEIVKVTHVEGNYFTVERGQQNTISKDYIAGTDAWVDFTAQHYYDLLAKSELPVRVTADDEFQYRNNAGEWVELKGGSNLALGNVANLKAQDKAGLKIELTWGDPADLIADGIPLAKWAGTMIRRKEGAYPSDEKDGTLLADITARDKHVTVPYVDSGLTDGTEYCYMLFPYTTDGVYTVDSANRVRATAVNKYPQDAPSAPAVSGIKLNKATVTGGDIVSLNKTDWFASPHEFTGLVTGREYTPYAKRTETETLLESPVAAGAPFVSVNKTEQAPPSAPVASGVLLNKATVTSDAGAEVSLDKADWFASPHEFTGLAEGQSYTPYARNPETDTKIASAVVSGGAFTAINKHKQSAPSAPSVTGITADGATVTGGDEVRIGTGVWFASPHTFTGLTEVTAYDAYARFKETADFYASPASAAKRFETLSGVPGPGVIIGGDSAAGFYGVIPASEFITGDALASAIGLTAGTSQNSNVDWLKFSIDGKTIFTPQKPIRHTISWDQINAVKAVKGEAIATIAGMRFKVRLFKGANTDPTPSSSGADVQNSEWNKLMLPIHERSIGRTWNYPANVLSTVPSWSHSLGTGVSKMFSDSDLLTHYNYGNGSYMWCQEAYSSNRIIRGSAGVSHSYNITPGTAVANRGWRPVLELL